MITVQEISKDFMKGDARYLPDGNYFREKGYFMNGKIKMYTPLHVYVKEQDLRLYFWFEGEFQEWFKKYLTITGDYEGEELEIYEMYSERRVKELNDHEPNLGNSIVARGYRYTLGGRKFYFVRRFVNVKLEVKWSKGGLV